MQIRERLNIVINTTDNIVFHFIEITVVEYTEKLPQKVILQNRIVFRKDTFKLLGLAFNQLHYLVNCLYHIGIIGKI